MKYEQTELMPNIAKTILHLCCTEEGSDTIYYQQNGYNVVKVTENVDVRKYMPPENVYGIIANPPCTHLAGSGARWWAEKGESALLEALEIVSACMRVILISKPKFWVLENPVGRLVDYLGKPKMYYQPYEYGDPYTKKTCLWGDFNFPKQKIVEPTEGSKMHKLPPSEDRAILRSQAPMGFTKAFFEANK